jgi:hypothetical protein
MTTSTHSSQHHDNHRCACPDDCPICGQAQGTRHDLECPWTRGSTGDPAFREWPIIAAEPTVLAAHTHRPGCPQVVRRPGGLFALIIQAHTQCLMCGALDTLDAETIQSFGGTIEGFEKCTACGQTFGWADIRTVL